MNLTSDHLQKLLGFPFRGPDWQTRLGIASLVALSGWVIPVIPWVLLMGYAVQIARRVAVEGHEPELLAWSDWSAFAVDGFRVLAVRLLAAAPLLLIVGLATSLPVGTSLGGALLIEAVGEAYRDLGAFIAGLGILTGIGLTLALIPISVIYGLVLPVPTMHVVVTGQIRALFQVRAWSALLRADLGAWALGYLVLIGIGLVVNLALSFATATIVLCFVMPFVLIVYLTYSVLISEVVFAQAYRSASLKLGLTPGAGAVTAPPP